jgi:hypothetical protein
LVLRVKWWGHNASIYSFRNTMSNDHGSYAGIPRRPLTSQESAWVHTLVLANPQWADVAITEMHVVAECTCGCRSVVLEEPPQPQNPKLIGHQGLVGEIDLTVKVNGQDDVISVLLHFAEGSLSLLEVVWYNFPEPVPPTWTEISRIVSVGR